MDRQIENQVRTQLRDLAGRGVDPNTIKFDWDKVKETQKDKACVTLRRRCCSGNFRARRHSGKQKGNVWTAAIGQSYRVIAMRRDNNLYWVWIGSHEDYNHVLTRTKQ